MKSQSNKEKIINTLAQKSVIKQNTFATCLNVFSETKNILSNLSEEMNASLSDVDKRVLFEYQDRGTFDAQLKFSGDILFFHMHSNIFEFNREHQIWKTPFVQKDPSASYCGIINIYNFLSDSFKFNRMEDLGYLVARIFINKDKFYFVEGKRQLGFMYNNFGQSKINSESLQSIIEIAIQYSLEFDLLVPPYDHVKIASVAQMNQKIEYARMKTGKRLGFQFNSDDID